MKCKICGRRAESELCELHEEARRNLRNEYEAWKRATDIAWNEYLKEIQRTPYAGAWVKEVARYLLSSSPSEEQGDSSSGQASNT